MEPGDPVRIEMTKWGDRPHWHIPAHWLGRDEHGEWLGIHPGTEMVRPGMRFVSTNFQVGLVPHVDLAEDRRRFSQLLSELDIPQPESGTATSFSNAGKLTTASTNCPTLNLPLALSTQPRTSAVC